MRQRKAYRWIARSRHQKKNKRRQKFRRGRRIFRQKGGENISVWRTTRRVSLKYLFFTVLPVVYNRWGVRAWGDQATIMNFSLCLIIIIIIITSSLILLSLLLFLLLYYVRLDTGFTILRNVHVLWVRAPLSKQYLKLQLFFRFPTTRYLSSILSHGVLRFTSPAPSRRTAITLRF